MHIKKHPLRVVTSCRSRFHIFDQARELQRQGILFCIIADYPKSYPKRFNISAKNINSLLFWGLIYHGLAKTIARLPVGYKAFLTRWMHDDFSRRLAKLIPNEANFFIGLSSLCLEALEECRSRGVLSAVDHGSLHLGEGLRLLNIEANRWGIKSVSSDSMEWVINKEDREFRCADSVFVLSTVARDSLVAHGVPLEKIFINPCGVDLSQFYEAEKKDNIFRVIQVGSISLGKGILTLLDAYSMARLSNSELIFVGAGLESSGLKTMIEKMKVSGVYFHKPVPQSNLREYYNQSSVFVLASVADGFGMVVLQAMACGLPVIITENVGAKDLIKDGVNGFIVPAGSPEAISARLRQPQSDSNLRRSMGLAAKLTVQNGFSWHDYGRRLTEYIKTRKKEWV